MIIKEGDVYQENKMGQDKGWMVMRLTDLLIKLKTMENDQQEIDGSYMDGIIGWGI